MRKTAMVLLVFTLAFVASYTISPMFAERSEAKPYICILTVYPYYVCEPSGRCQVPGEEYCWECNGRTPAGDPCLCSRVGCMVPPQ